MLFKTKLMQVREASPDKGEQVNCLLISLFLTNVFGVDLSRPPAGKIYFN
jgi:hypothetical protein